MTIKSLEELMQDEFHPCPLCQSPTGGEGFELCDNCEGINKKLPEFLGHENAREFTKELIRQIEYPQSN